MQPPESFVKKRKKKITKLYWIIFFQLYMNFWYKCSFRSCSCKKNTGYCEDLQDNPDNSRIHPSTSSEILQQNIIMDRNTALPLLVWSTNPLAWFAHPGLLSAVPPYSIWTGFFNQKCLSLNSSVSSTRFI